MEGRVSRLLDLAFLLAITSTLVWNVIYLFTPPCCLSCLAAQWGVGQRDRCPFREPFFYCDILTRNSPGNWVILTFSGQKPWTRIRISHSFSIIQGLKMSLVICSNTEENFWWEPEKMNVKFHNITSYTWNFDNFSSVYTIMVKFDIYYFSLTPMKNFLWCYYWWLITATSLALGKCKRECNIL